MIVKKYEFSLTNLMGTAGPDRFVTDLAEAVDAHQQLRLVQLHFYTFGGLRTTADWARQYTAARW